MRQFLYLSIFWVTLLTCKSKIKETTLPINKVKYIKECPPGGDTINLVTTFTKDTAKAPLDRFQSIVRFISDKGLFKPYTDKNGRLKVSKEMGKVFPVAYDSCNMKRWVNKNFIIENIQVTSLDFKGSKKDRYKGFTPGLHLEEWKFANNADRDSTIKIVQKAYTYPNNIVIYEKRYSQFILDDKRIFLLEAGAKFAEPYAIEYKASVEYFIMTNKSR
jgi:hypothetical protein